MKSALQAKLLKHFASKKNKNGGFTLIELLVVIVIIGILAAVALPSMLGQANRAREASARSGLGVINRAQQAYRVQNATFATDYDQLEIQDPSTADYTIEISSSNNATQGNSTATPAGNSAGDLTTFYGCVSEDGGVTEAEVQETTCGGGDDGGDDGGTP